MSDYPGTNLIDYPFPIRKDSPPAHLVLPSDLTQSEVDRLVVFLKALVRTESPSNESDLIRQARRALQRSHLGRTDDPDRACEMPL